jgi:competence protein ComEC
MVSSAWLALAVLCLLQMMPTLPDLLLVPELAVISVILIWMVCGGKAGLALVAGMWALFSAGWTIDDRLDTRLAGQDILVQGTVCEIPRADRTVRRFIFEPAAKVPGVPGRIFVSWYDATATPAAGELWQLKLRMKRPRGLSNPAGFDFERWAHRTRLGATGYVRRSALNRRLSSHSSHCRLTGLRQRIAVRIGEELADHPAAAHIQALTVGVKNGMNSEEWALLRRTGTVHLMAISGLHIGLVALFMHFLGRQCGRLLLLAGVRNSPLAIGRVCALIGAIGYAGLAGFSVPTVRALVTVLIAVTLTTLRRSVSVWQVLASALLVVLIVEPAAPLSMGFWLSFYAVGLLLLNGLHLTPADAATRPPIVRMLSRVKAMMEVQLRLAVGLGPLSLLFFDQVSLIAPLANLVIVPLFALIIVPLALLGTVFLWASPLLANISLELAAGVTDQALGVLDWLDSLPLTVWRPPPISEAGLCGIVGLTLMLLWPRPVPGRWLVVGLFSALVSASLITVPPTLRIVVMDVGQGLAVLVQTSRHALVFDTGPAYRGRDAGQSVVLPTLRKFDVRQLDAIVISHGDADHRGGAQSLITAFPDASVIAPERVNIDSANKEACEAGKRWVWDDVAFSFLHPMRDQQNADWSENDDSCVLLVSSTGGDVLLPGDIEYRAESYLTSNHMIPAVDVVVAPHHGSKSSSSEPFVAATRPRFVIFSTGHRNRWGFPAESVSSRWRNAGAEGITTADSGAVVFAIDRSGRLALQRRERPDGRRIWTEIDD